MAHLLDLLSTWVSLCSHTLALLRVQVDWTSHNPKAPTALASTCLGCPDLVTLHQGQILCSVQSLGQGRVKMEGDSLPQGSCIGVVFLGLLWLCLDWGQRNLFSSSAAVGSFLPRRSCPHSGSRFLCPEQQWETRILSLLWLRQLLPPDHCSPGSVLLFVTNTRFQGVSGLQEQPGN